MPLDKTMGKHIEKTVGLSLEEIRRMSPGELSDHVKKRNAKKKPMQNQHQHFENCVTCAHRISYAYYTIRCSVWTEEVRDHLIAKGEDTEHNVGRIHRNMRCQHYTKLP